MTPRRPTMMVTISRMAGLLLIAYSLYSLFNANYINTAMGAAFGGMLYGNAANRKLKGAEKVLFLVIMIAALGLTLLGIVLRTTQR